MLIQICSHCTIFIPINITVGTSIPEATYIGDADIAEVNVSFSVRCAAVIMVKTVSIFVQTL